jgi:hypothetical protein
MLAAKWWATGFTADCSAVTATKPEQPALGTLRPVPKGRHKPAVPNGAQLIARFAM